MGFIEYTTPHTDVLAICTKATDLYLTYMGIQKAYILLDFHKQIPGAFIIAWAALWIEFLLETISISTGHWWNCVLCNFTRIMARRIFHSLASGSLQTFFWLHDSHISSAKCCKPHLYSHVISRSGLSCPCAIGVGTLGSRNIANRSYTGTDNSNLTIRERDRII